MEIKDEDVDCSIGTVNCVPVEVLDLLRFMCATWSEIDHWAYSDCDIMKYPLIQGTKNQINLRKIGEQNHDNKKFAKAIEWVLAH